MFHNCDSPPDHSTENCRVASEPSTENCLFAPEPSTKNCLLAPPEPVVRGSTPLIGEDEDEGEDDMFLYDTETDDVFKISWAEQLQSIKQEKEIR